MAAVVSVDPSVTEHVRRMRAAAGPRDEAMARVCAVRDGRFNEVWPGAFSERYPTAIVANRVDVMARDLASNLSPLPALACTAGQMKSAVDKRRAEKKNRIGFNYWRHSRLEYQMKWGADQYLSYGFLPMWVEPDLDDKVPYIHIEDPAGAYFELDRRGRCKRYARTWDQDLEELATEYEEYKGIILRDREGKPREMKTLEVVRYTDETTTMLYLPQIENIVLGSYKHRYTRDNRPACPVHISIRPGLHANPRGMFDDVLWVQLAHSVMAALTLEAGHKAVQAPISVPSDVQELSVGPDAVIVSDKPDQIRRVPLEVPQAAFALGEQLQQELKEGAGYPDTRFGVGPAGGSTGRGVSALEGGYDSQIKLGQDVIGLGLKVATEIAFATDKAWWPNKAKTISGNLSGESFLVTYTPAVDLAEHTTCDVTYGFAAGLSPNAAIVTLLQMQQGEIIDRDTFRRNLPMDLDVEHIQRMIDIEQTEGALKQGLFASLQAVGQMMAAGQPGLAIQLMQLAQDVIKGRQDGKELSDLFTASLQRMQDAAQQAQQQQAAAQQGGPPGPGGPPGQGGDGGPLPGVGPNGLPQGVAPGQAGQPPGGRPSVMDLTAGFTGGGAPTMGAGLHQRVATGA